MHFSERFETLRIDKDLTQKEVANMLKITQQQYQLYESGKREFKIEHIVKLCRYYEVSADYILGLPKGLNWPR